MEVILCSCEIKFALAMHHRFVVKGHEHSAYVPLRIGYDVLILCSISSDEYRSHCTMLHSLSVIAVLC